MLNRAPESAVQAPLGLCRMLYTEFGLVDVSFSFIHFFFLLPSTHRPYQSFSLVHHLDAFLRPS